MDTRTRKIQTRSARSDAGTEQLVGRGRIEPGNSDLSISRFSFHDQLKGETALNLALMHQIHKPSRKTPFFGLRQMIGQLPNAGHPIEEKWIRRLMRVMPICQKPNTRQPTKGHKIYGYLSERIARDFAPSDPGVGYPLFADVMQGIASL